MMSDHLDLDALTALVEEPLWHAPGRETVAALIAAARERDNAGSNASTAWEAFATERNRAVAAEREREDARAEVAALRERVKAWAAVRECEPGGSDYHRRICLGCTYADTIRAALTTEGDDR